jgi:hypothetical protein
MAHQKARKKFHSPADARAEALRILAANPGVSGAELGAMCGKSGGWGSWIKRQLAKPGAPA